VEHGLEHAPANAQTVKVIGQQWFWTFEHQDGKQEVGELHLTAGVPYRFEIVSKDVIHSFNIPDFTVLMDAVPGRVNTIWNNFDKPGEYLIQCREYCGLLHYNMRAKLFVAPATEATSSAGGGGATTATAGANAPLTANQTSGGGGGGGNATTPTTTAAGGVSLSILQGASIQGNPAYSPNPLTVKKGDSISVVNKDTVPHTVTNGKDPSDPNSAKLFDTSIINAGQSAQVTTTKLSAGQQYPFHCTVHPYMTGTLKVS
jgi:cytochrome c oxidase subunit 2